MSNNQTAIEEFNKTVRDLIDLKFRFSVTHNPDGKYLAIISATEPDRIKKAFPLFNIYLSDAHAKTKIVELYFHY